MPDHESSSQAKDENCRDDNIINENIREKVGVAPIEEKFRETRLRWYARVLR